MEINIVKLTYTYKDKTKALDNLKLLIKDNKITSIVGPCDAGKTTLAWLLALKLLPQTGEIKIDHITVSKKNEKRLINKLKTKIGLVSSEEDYIFSKSTILEEIESTLNHYHYKTKNLYQRVLDSLKIVGLNDTYLKRNPESLSTGEKEKVKIALALSYNPKVIIFDEPTLNLDAHNKQELVKLIRMMKIRYGKTIVIFSRDTDFIHMITDYVYIINNGKIKRRGNKYKIFSDEKLLGNNNLAMPQIISFSHLVETKKNVKIGHRDDINDLMKDVYRYVR